MHFHFQTGTAGTLTWCSRSEPGHNPTAGSGSNLQYYQRPTNSQSRQQGMMCTLLSHVHTGNQLQQTVTDLNTQNIASFPWLPPPFLYTAKGSKTGWWEGLGTTLQNTHCHFAMQPHLFKFTNLNSSYSTGSFRITGVCCTKFASGHVKQDYYQLVCMALTFFVEGDVFNLSLVSWQSSSLSVHLQSIV